MTPQRRRNALRATAIAGAFATAGALVFALPSSAQSASGFKMHEHAASKHVLLISVDGLHQSDLAWYIAQHPTSALANLVKQGTEYTNAATTFPSDSFPGMVAQATGGGAGTTGVYYDDTYNRTLFAPGTVDCNTATPGTEVPWTEAIDRSQNPIQLDAGQGINSPSLHNLLTNTTAQTLADAAGITAGALQMTSTPQTLLDPNALPVNPDNCTPLYPHNYIKVNTIFEVARNAGLRTAWSDKHAAYEILNGPSGTGVQDLFTPEINSQANASGQDFTNDNALTQLYDGIKVAAVINEINGYDHSGTTKVGAPAIFGMNFQSVSTAEKLPKSDGLTGGYNTDGTPGPLLSNALDFVNKEISSFVDAIAKAGLTDSTTIIVSAKHGQSPTDLASLRRVDDGAIIDGLNAAWAAQHPDNTSLVAWGMDDDAMLFWLSDRSAAAEAFAKDYLLTHSAPANLAGDPKGTYSSSVSASGLTQVFTGAAADKIFGAPLNDPHAPDLVGYVQHGVVYTGNIKKIAEHGGNDPQDRHVALIVSGAGADAGAVVDEKVKTTQIAPTILSLLGLNPDSLQAVRIEHTEVLPGS